MELAKQNEEKIKAKEKMAILFAKMLAICKAGKGDWCSQFRTNLKELNFSGHPSSESDDLDTSAVLEGPCAKIEDWFSVIHVRIMSTDRVNADGDLVTRYLPAPMVKTPEKR